MSFTPFTNAAEVRTALTAAPSIAAVGPATEQPSSPLDEALNIRRFTVPILQLNTESGQARVRVVDLVRQGGAFYWGASGDPR
ncbi:MAG: hypothetical protein AAF851_06285 [Myxococcota bacterium]